MAEDLGKRLENVLNLRKQYNEERKESQRNQIIRLQKEREDLMRKREELRAQNEMVYSRSSTALSGSPQIKEKSVGEIVQRTIKNIPRIERELNDLKSDLHRYKRTANVPYNGEWGITSYETSQLHSYYMVHSILMSWLEDALNSIFNEHIPNTKEKIRKVSKQASQTIEKHNSLLEYHSILEDVCLKLISEAIEPLVENLSEETFECYQKIQQTVDQMILDSAKTFALMLPKGKEKLTSEQEGSNEQLIYKVYSELKRKRNQSPSMWKHNQSFTYIGREQLLPSVDKAVSAADSFDGTILLLHKVPASDQLDESTLSQDFVRFRKKELKYWNGKECSKSLQIPLEKKWKGICCSSLTSPHLFLALGTVQGELLIVDLTGDFKIHRVGKSNSSIINLVWSTNAKHIAAVNLQGDLQVWSSSDSNEERTEPLRWHCSLTLEAKDLNFRKGMLVDSNQSSLKADITYFHPNKKLQDSLFVGLSNGNILKLNIGPFIKDSESTESERIPPVNDMNVIGKGVEAELFKAHKEPILFIGFVVNTSNGLVTVDVKGFINIWSYELGSLNGFGFFQPLKQFWLKLEDTTYKPDLSVPAKIVFTDVVKGQGRRLERKREEMKRKRREVQTEINKSFLGEPWMIDDQDDQKVTYVYAPDNIPDSGAVFHLVTYYNDSSILASYKTQIYKPSLFACNRLLSCQMNLSGSFLVFTILFPSVNNQDPYVSFVPINMSTMQLGKTRVNIPLEDKEYELISKEDVCCTDITDVSQVLNSTVFVINLVGTVYGFSITTGRIVLAKERPGLIGCHLLDEHAQVIPRMKIICASLSDAFLLVMYAKRQNYVTIVAIKDKDQE